MTTASEQEQRWEGTELLVCAFIQLILVNVAYRIDRKTSAPLISTSSWAIFFGLACGAVLYLYSSEQRVHSAGLNPQILFLGLLPPIILEAGFNTKQRGFFSNFVVILSLTVLGTLIATFVTGGILIGLGELGLITQLPYAEAFLYGSLISAIDPVATLLVFKKCNAPSMLFNLVFGESVLNDAVAIALFVLFKDFVASGQTNFTVSAAFEIVRDLGVISLGSVALSAVICYSSAYVLRHSDPALKEHPTYEISVILIAAYASYLSADLFGLSGILSVFFSGVFIRHYHLYSISEASASALRHILSTFAFLSENFIYLYLGISVIAFRHEFYWDWWFVLANFVACLIARACNTFPLCGIANTWRSKKRRIPFKYMVVIWFSGLRGAIAFALALNVETPDPHHAAIIKSSTLFTVLFTTVFFGMGTGPLLHALGLANNGNEEHAPISSSLSMIGSRAAALELPPLATEASPLLRQGGLRSPSQSVHHAWVELDENYLKPMFGGKPRTRVSAETRASATSSTGAIAEGLLVEDVA